MARSKRAAKRRNGIFLKIALLGFAVYMVYSMISLQSQLSQKKKELSAHLDSISSQKLEIDQMKELLKSGSKDELIERAARDKLDFIFKNEEIYEDVSGK